MGVRAQKALMAVAASGALFVAACQGNLGTGGSGLTLPQTPGYGQPAPGGPGAPGTQSRQRMLEGAVTSTADLAAVPLPALDGFSVTISLGTPTPAPSPSATMTAVPLRPHGRKAVAGANRAVDSVAQASPQVLPSAAPASAASPDTAASALSADNGSASPGAGHSGSGAAGTAGAAAGAGAAGSASKKIATKTTIYPEDAPAPPSPQPSGNVQTFLKRTALVRGFVSSVDDLALYGLGAVRFTLPASEAVTQRGFTVAVFEAAKKHHEKLIAFDTQAGLTDASVASALAADPLTLKKNTGYLLVLYGDELPATPAPVASGYAAPGNNPFVTPIPSGYPGGPGGPPAGPASPPPFGSATIAPGTPARF